MNKKRKRTNLCVKQKLEFIEKLESGVSITHVCEECGMKKQTVPDICKAMISLKKIVLVCIVDAPNKPR
jgi:predicted transcriptional regulator